MPVINSVTMTISQTLVARPPQPPVTITYSYTITLTAAEKAACAAADEAGTALPVYTISCEVWGEDLIWDDLLGTPPYDTHTLNCLQLQPGAATRTFTVPAGTLDEDFGKDEIYLKLIVTDPSGGTTTATSAVVAGYF